MYNNKKASAKAGQKQNHVHFPAITDRPQAIFSKCLTGFTRARYTGCTVLNTPRLAVSAPVSHSGFFTSIGFYLPGILPAWFGQWPGSAQPYKSLRAKTASRLSAVLKYLAAPQQGVISTIRLGAVMAKKSQGKSARILSRLTVYNFVRTFAGPVAAHRVAFRVGGAA